MPENSQFTGMRFLLANSDPITEKTPKESSMILVTEVDTRHGNETPIWLNPDRIVEIRGGDEEGATLLVDVGAIPPAKYPVKEAAHAVLRAIEDYKRAVISETM
jgi:uncharacterized protein YlzI (FlbEa/FlbD family)